MQIEVITIILLGLYILNKSSKNLNNDFKAIEFENRKDKIKKDINNLLELYINENELKSIKKRNIEEKLKEKDKELK